MEVKPGYKQTEVGVIPEEWGTKLLPDVAWFQEGPGLRNWQFTRTGMKVVNVTNLENGVLNLDRTDRHISISLFSRMYQHFAIDANDIVMASSGNSYSKTAVVREQDLPLVMNTSVIRFKPQKVYDNGFLWAILNAPLFKNQIDLMITGGAQPNFGPYHLKRINVPLPPLPEQRTIATALCDVDALLDGLDRLIAKKRDLKQAAMQQLLTGKTRLPGFEGEWEVKRVLDLGEVVTGGTPRTDVSEFWGDEYPWITPTDISSCRDMFSSERGLTQQGLGALRPLPANSVLVTCIASIGKNCILKTAGSCNQQINAVIPNNESCAKFLYYLFEASKQYLLANAGITATSIISKATFAELTFRIPSFSEQTAIATVLSDMDAEIAALEQRRNKTKDIKQAMMRELLTGKTRLMTPVDQAHNVEQA
jgi:type I restriction enzyme S subunit